MNCPFRMITHGIPDIDRMEAYLKKEAKIEKLTAELEKVKAERRDNEKG